MLKNSRNDDFEILEEDIFEDAPKAQTKKHGTKKKALIAAGALMLSGAFAAGSMYGSLGTDYALAETAETTEAAEAEEAENYEIYTGDFKQTAMLEDVQADSVLPDLSAVVESALASVVSITNTIEMTTTGGGQSADPFEYWFGFGGRNYNYGQDQTPSTQEAQAAGSGVIIGENGEELLIATNNHVAVYDESGNSYFYSYTATTKELKVTFVDGTEHVATLKGANKRADLAVIAVPLSDLSEETKDAIRVATISDDEVKVGQGVIAIGNALGKGQTATVGYVSALDRDVTTEDGITRTEMQVDAAINKGNSGGGLFNSKGELIGINSAKNTSQGVEAFGYAIPLSSAKDILNQLKDQTPRDVLAVDERGYLGIYGQDVDTVRVNNYGFPAGAQIVSITPESPAEAAGLQINDIITAVNGVDIMSYEELRTELSYYAPDTEILLTVQRIEGNEFVEENISVTLASHDSMMQ